MPTVPKSISSSVTSLSLSAESPIVSVGASSNATVTSMLTKVILEPSDTVPIAVVPDPPACVIVVDNVFASVLAESSSASNFQAPPL